MCIITMSVKKSFCLCDQNYALYATFLFSIFIFRNQHLKMPVCVCSSLIVSSLMMKILWKSELCKSGTDYKIAVLLRSWQTRTHCCGYINCCWVDTNVSPFARACNISCGHKFCVQDTKNVSVFVQKHFASATNVSQFGQPKKHHGQQCVRNNVSSFTRTFIITMCTCTLHCRWAKPSLKEYPMMHAWSEFHSTDSLRNTYWIFMLVIELTLMFHFRSMKERRQVLEKNVTVIPNKIMLSETNFLKVPPCIKIDVWGLKKKTSILCLHAFQFKCFIEHWDTHYFSSCFLR